MKRGSFERTIPIRADATGYYSLHFFNCDPDAIVSFNVFIFFIFFHISKIEQNLFFVEKMEYSMTNPGPNYLSVGESPLTMVYPFYGLLYLFVFFFWMGYSSRFLFSSSSCFFQFFNFHLLPSTSSSVKGFMSFAFTFIFFGKCAQMGILTVLFPLSLFLNAFN